MNKTLQPKLTTGFTLIEVLVAGAIVSICIVILFHVFSISIRGIRVTQDYTRGKLLLQRKMTEFEIGGIPKNIHEDFEEFMDPFSNFKWKVEVGKKIILGVKMKKVTLIVQLPERSDNRVIKVTTYFK